MSLTQSRGLNDVGQWTAVATTLAEHIDALQRAGKRSDKVSPPPAGAIEAARRFFQFVLNGIALDQKRDSSVPSVPHRAQASAAGISNLSIAVRVIRSEEPNAPSDDLALVQREIQSLLDTLEHLKTRPANELKSLSKFLRELQRQGEIERDAAIAYQEGPRTYRNPLL